MWKAEILPVASVGQPPAADLFSVYLELSYIVYILRRQSSVVFLKWFSSKMSTICCTLTWGEVDDSTHTSAITSTCSGYSYINTPIKTTGIAGLPFNCCDFFGCCGVASESQGSIAPSSRRQVNFLPHLPLLHCLCKIVSTCKTKHIQSTPAKR